MVATIRKMVPRMTTWRRTGLLNYYHREAA